MGPDAPSGFLMLYFGSRDSLVIAIVPFGQRLADLHLFAQPTKNTGATGPLQGGAEHCGKVLIAEDGCQGSGLCFSFRQQLKFGAPGVLTMKSPFRGAMPEEPQLALQHLALHHLARHLSHGRGQDAVIDEE